MTRCRGQLVFGRPQRCKREVKPGYDVCQFHLAQARVVPRSGVDTLTPRQLQVARLAAKGLSNEAIGKKLRMATSTVNVHMREVTRRTGVHRGELAEVLAS